MAALYADENVPRAVVELLRSLGHDVLTAFDAGRANQRLQDAEQLQFAAAHNRAILTNNGWDFHRLHSRDSDHAGIVTFTDDRDEDALAHRIHVAIMAAGLLVSQLIRIVHPTNP